ncbi:hypothetical protein GQ53DRAFT_805738 [Thozetella sp. PMI_491]|nr:hypothetical protein GQ53DRAFT_805738 [Thozetella sp. PMI_491]
MQLHTLFLSTLVTAFVSAAPAAEPEAVAKRACTVRYPDKTPFTVNLNSSSPTAIVSFTGVPTNVVGPCSLVAQFPANYLIATTGNSQVNFRPLEGPAPNSLVGTYTFAQSSTARYNTINSFACRANFNFQLSLAGSGSCLVFRFQN